VTKPTPGESEAKIRQTNALAASFLGYVEKVNHPTNCAALYGK